MSSTMPLKTLLVASYVITFWRDYNKDYLRLSSVVRLLVRPDVVA